MYRDSPYGSPVLNRGMFQQQMNPQFLQMLQMRDNLRMQQRGSYSTPLGGRASTPDITSMMGNPNMGTPFDSETFNGEATPFDGQLLGAEATDAGSMVTDNNQFLQNLGQAVSQLQQQQNNLSQHLGATPGASPGPPGNFNRGLGSLIPQPNVLRTQGPESLRLSGHYGPELR